MEKTWLVWGIGLKTLEITAISFDNAIDIARIINPNYCIAQLKNKIGGMVKRGSIPLPPFRSIASKAIVPK